MKRWIGAPAPPSAVSGKKRVFCPRLGHPRLPGTSLCLGYSLVPPLDGGSEPTHNGADGLCS